MPLEALLVSSNSGYWGLNVGDADADVLIIRNGDVKPSVGVRWNGLPCRSLSRPEVEKSRVQAGDVLLMTSGDCGVTAYVDDTPATVTCASNFIRILRFDKTLVNPKFAFHYLQTKAFRASLQPYIRGTTLQNLSTRQAFPTVCIPLPSLDEQCRITAILDQADALRAKRRQALAHVKDLTQSVFLGMFGHPVTNDRHWPVSPLGSLATTTSGGTPNRGESGNYGGPIPWVKSGELHTDLVRETEESLTHQGLAGSSAKLMPKGTVLVAMYGATAGAVSMLGVEAATNQAICSISPGSQLEREYLIATLRAMKSSLLSKRSGGAQPNLSQGVLRSLMIPTPPLDAQGVFGEQVHRIDRLKERMSSTEMDALFTSIQSRAFEGCL
jgi:type I restriction enzyme S subunit